MNNRIPELDEMIDQIILDYDHVIEHVDEHKDNRSIINRRIQEISEAQKLLVERRFDVPRDSFVVYERSLKVLFHIYREVDYRITLALCEKERELAYERGDFPRPPKPSDFQD